MKGKTEFAFILLVFAYLPNVVKPSELTMALIKQKEGSSGNAMALSKNQLFIGCTSGGMNKPGMVLVFDKLANGSWVHNSNLSGSDTHDKNWYGFGYAIAISDITLVVGSIDTNENGRDAGSVHVFEKSSSGWLETTKLLPNDGVEHDHCGTAVAISGSMIVIGCSNRVNGIILGAAYVFEFYNAWRQTAKLLGRNSSFFYYTGFIDNIVIRGDMIFVGSRYRSGHVLIFTKTADNFFNISMNLTTSAATTASTNHNGFGRSLALSGNTLAVGSIKEINNNGYSSGCVYLFEIVGNDVKEKNKLCPADGRNGDGFGASVAIFGNLMIVGAPYYGTYAYNGALYLFHKVHDQWILETKLTNADLGGWGLLGNSVALNADVAVVDSINILHDNSTVYIFNHDYKNTLEINVNLSSSNRSTLQCFVDRMTSFWEKSLFPLFIGKEAQVTLLDNSCNKVHSNSTTFWIITKYDACGTITHEKKNHIIRTNKATIVFKNLNHSYFVRDKTYEYEMSCMFERKHTLETKGHNVTDKTLTTNISSSAEFNISISMYESPVFATKLSYPIQVIVNEPMYFGITMKENTDVNIKIVVQDCFATTSEDIVNNHNYLFYKNKCPLDQTFKTLKLDNNHFNFVINTFRYVEVSKAVYIQCGLWVCTKNSTYPECIQGCLTRKRRDTQLRNAKLVFVSSGQIVYTKKNSCKVITCQNFEQCIDMYPAVCRCITGFIRETNEMKCVNKRIVQINDLYFSMKWTYAYADTSSTQFHQLAYRIETQLNALFSNDLQFREIENVKVIAARPDGKLDVMLLYSNNTGASKVIEKLDSLRKDKNSNPIFQQIRISRENIPTIKQVSKLNKL